ncbi:MAG: pyruvate ferredoxin oxidoreductase [Eubacteriales bacterium]|jgi:pyruvate ferredoxin oxidoreductase alpha subunit|nr:pyruvate ferredoxin oxidoreductase [Eubacteriales bacterium]
MGKREFINGNNAVAYGVKLARAEIVAAYPITPQTKIVEQISEFISNGEMNAEFIKVESEHTAMSACYAASCTGARTFTATSSQGLLYMFEMMQFTSGQRRPVVMANVNRAISPPWTIWLDHQDSISTRDAGWIQIYVESAQEALDTTIQCFKVAENKEVLTPVMICLDAFVLSHTEELVDIPEQAEIDRFLPPFEPDYKVDVNRPLTIAAGTAPNLYMEFRFTQQQGMLKAINLWKKADEEFGRLVGRSYGGVVENYKCSDADVILVTMGSLSSTAKDVVDSLREQGTRAGLAKLRLYRPFPEKEIFDALKSAKAIGVVDRSLSFGFEGSVFSDVKAALYNNNCCIPGVNFIVGLGGRDVTADDLKKMYDKLQYIQKNGKAEQTVEFIGLRWSE